MYYPEEIVEEVRMKNDIIDVISGYVKLQKKGSNHVGLCPFHNEKTPSFSVSAGKQMYYCFGCGAGGNVFTFIMEYENYSFSEALQMLAERSGVSLPKMEYSKEAKRQADIKNILLEINKSAAGYFYYQLHQEQGQAAYQYFVDRELSEETIRKFGLGYSNKNSDDLYRYLKTKGYTDDILKETGLVTIEERGTFDKFWNRVMFPIMDVNNRVIGFGGRVMGEGMPKYLNSPETRLFDKSRNLYGMNYARISREKFMLICEGYMDVIALHQAGFTNAVASLGTAFTSQQAMLLKRYTEQVILTYDNDGAGIKAALRALPILKEAGLSAKILNMEPYKDPDEFIKNMGSEKFRERIREAQNSFLFEILTAKRDYDMDDPEQKTKFFHHVARKLLEFPDALERDTYLQAVSREFYIPALELKQLVNRLASQLGPVRTEVKSSAALKKQREKDDGPRQSQRLLLTWLIEKPELYHKIKTIITPDDFKEVLYHQVASMVFEECQNGAVNPAGILNRFIDDKNTYNEVASLFNTSIKGALDDEAQRKAFSETVKKVKKNSLDIASRNASDLNQLQEIIRAQSELKMLNISFD